MPKCDGVEMLSVLRAQGDNRPVVVLATEVSDEQLVRLLQSGANAIVFKDGPESELLQAIDAVQQGKTFIDSQLVSRAFRLSAKQPASGDFDLLSDREMQIARCVAEGLRNRQIGAKLGMTEGTVKVFLHNIYTKTGLSNRTELAIGIRKET